MSLRNDTRGRGIINVMLWFFGLLFGLWVFFLIVTNALEPLREVVLSFDTVQDRGHASAVNNLWRMTTVVAPLLLMAGGVMLIIIFSVWREQFLGQRRRRP